jgi:hypothetical protein
MKDNKYIHMQAQKRQQTNRATHPRSLTNFSITVVKAKFHVLRLIEFNWYIPTWSTTYTNLNDVRSPISPRYARLSWSRARPSTCARIAKICKQKLFLMLLESCLLEWSLSIKDQNPNNSPGQFPGRYMEEYEWLLHDLKDQQEFHAD